MKQKGFAPIFVFLAIVIVFIGYLVIKNNFPNRVSDIIPSPTPAPTIEAVSEWETYMSYFLNIQFKAPAQILKNIKESIATGADSGNEICINDQYNQRQCSFSKFGVSAISKDYNCGCGGNFTMNKGYVKSGTHYYTSENIEYDNNLVKEITNPNGVKILKVTGKSTNTHSDIPAEGRIGAIINTNDPKYPGIAIQMELNEDIGLNEEVFNQILSTFKFTHKTKIGDYCAGKENIICSRDQACRIKVIGKPELGGVCVDEAETNP